jgi:hypothetical protein
MKKFENILLSASVLLAGCSWEPLPPPAPVPADKVFLMYDNIGEWFDNDVAEAGRAVAAGMLRPDERVVVYERVETGNVIYELVKDSSQRSGFAKKTWMQFNPGQYDMLNRETLAAVVSRIRDEIYPEAPHWGFAFGSHGSGWLPKEASMQVRRALGPDDPFAPLWTLPENPLTRYFMSDTRMKLDVVDFADALDRWDWNFMILDDCFMTSIEALYDMRRLAEYIIASPTEIMDAGFPYDKVVESVFANWTRAGFEEVGRQYVQFYRGYGEYPYGTVAVIETAGLDALAAATRDVVRAENVVRPDAAEANAMQTYEGLTAHVFYDFDQYIALMSQNNPDLYERFAEQLARVVVYKGHTEHFPTIFPSGRYITPMPVDPDHYSGVSAFIPTEATVSLTGFWEQTPWYKAVYGE